MHLTFTVLFLIASVFASAHSQTDEAASDQKLNGIAYFLPIYQPVYRRSNAIFDNDLDKINYENGYTITVEPIRPREKIVPGRQKRSPACSAAASASASASGR